MKVKARRCHKPHQTIGRMDYNFSEIEKKWQKVWHEQQTYKVVEDASKTKFYVLNMFPYPSGAGLHVGHPLGYIASDIYARYLEAEESTYELDRDFWVEIFHELFATDEELAEMLEQNSIYWEDDLKCTEKAETEERPASEDEAVARQAGAYQSLRLENGPVEIVKDFVEKTLRKSEQENAFDDEIRPAFKDEDDERFARMLFRQTLLKYSEQMKLIEPVLSTEWSSERLADIDALLLNLGLTEFLYFPMIPTQITINEYVELAKHFSTAHSASFVNGVLDALARKLKEEGKILKQ